jgi:hypothetical protein
MSNLSIRKKSLNTWLHTDSIFGDFIISKFYFNSFFAKFQIVEEGNTRLEKYEIANITLYDDTNGGTPETFSTITELSLRLEALQYPAFDRTGSTIFPSMEQITNVNVTDIEDNQVLAWDVATSKWVNITIGSTSTPTLQDVTEAGAETTVKTIFRTSETEWVEIGGDNNGIAVYNDVFGTLPTPKRIIDIAYNGLGINTYDTDTGEPTGSAGIGDKTLVAAEVVGGVQGKYTIIYPDRIIKGINGTTSFDSFLPSENNDLNGSKVISTNTTAKNAINYLAVSNLTMTDITPPSEGAFYEVTVINGTTTIGGVGYTAGALIYRFYNGSSWVSTNMNNAITIDATPTDGSSNAVSSNGVFDALNNLFITKILKENAFWYLPTGFPLSVGLSYSSNISPWPFTLSGYTTGSKGMVLANTTSTAGTIAFKRRHDGWIFNGIEMTLTQKIQFQTNISGQRFFHGLTKNNQFTAPTNVDQTTLTNIVGVCQLSTSTNMHVIHNDASGTATTIDLGADYPCNTAIYNYFITIEQNASNYVVTVERVTVSTGASISTTNTLSTNIMNYLTDTIMICTWITNNATASVASYLDGGAIGKFKN